jgi:hypothetical protein
VLLVAPESIFDEANPRPRRTAALAQALHERGHEVTLAYFVPTEREARFLRHRQEHAFPTHALAAEALLRRPSQALLRELVRRVELIHLHGCTPALALSLLRLARREDRALHLDLDGHPLRPTHGWPAPGKRQGGLVRRLLQSCDSLTIAEGCPDPVGPQGRRRRPCRFLCPHILCVEAPNITPAQDSARAPRPIRLATAAPREREETALLALFVARELRHQGMSLELTIHCPRESRPELEQQARMLGLLREVHWQERLDDATLIQSLRRHAVFLAIHRPSPLRDAELPCGVLAATAAGCLVLASDTQPVRRALPGAARTASTDIRDVARSLRALLAEERTAPLRATWRGRRRSRVLRRAVPGRAAEQLLTAYHHALWGRALGLELPRPRRLLRGFPGHNTLQII